MSGTVVSRQSVSQGETACGHEEEERSPRRVHAPKINEPAEYRWGRHDGHLVDGQRKTDGQASGFPWSPFGHLDHKQAVPAHAKKADPSADHAPGDEGRFRWKKWKQEDRSARNPKHPLQGAKPVSRQKAVAGPSEEDSPRHAGKKQNGYHRPRFDAGEVGLPRDEKHPMAHQYHL